MDEFLENVENITAREMLNLVQEVESSLHSETKKKKQGDIATEGGLVRIPPSGSLVVVGDVHGDFESLLQVLVDSHVLEGIEKGRMRILFLGDYGDRGSKSPEVYVAVLRLKMTFPDSVILLRGNHEGPKDLQAIPHDLPSQLRNRFGNRGKGIYEELQRLWEALHHAAIIDGEYLFLHGGIPSLVESIDDIAQANLTHPKASHLEEMLWNDPSEDMEGTAPSPRGAGKLFGEDVTSRILRLLGVKTLIRAHEACSDGVSVSHKGMILTIFSRKGVPYGNTQGAYLNLDVTRPALSAYDLSGDAILF